VDVEDPVLPVPDEVGGKDFHGAGFSHALDLLRAFTNSNGEHS